MRCLLALLLAAPVGAVDSDAERLVGPLPAGFERPTVRIFPVVAQDRDPRAQQAWLAFAEALAARPNLAASTPAATVEALTLGSPYVAGVERGQRDLGRGYADYREVQLEPAMDALRAAVATFRAVDHHFVKPREVARAQLTVGLAQLESGDPSSAEAAMRAALLLDPTLELRKGYDRPEAIAALERARAALAADGTAPAEFTELLTARSLRTIDLYGRSAGGHLEVAVHLSGGISIQQQPLTDDPAADGERLASRVWACLPFGRTPPKPGHRSRLLIDAGFGYHVFTSAPVTFSNFGLGANLSWLVAPNLALDFQASVANSGRDAEEDLRQDIASARFFVGPGFSAATRRLRATASLGLEAALASKVVLTSSAACKVFSEEDDPPDELCDHDRQIHSDDGGLLMGAGVSVSGGVRLVDQVFLTLRLHVAHYLFDPQDTGLGVPVGGQIALGYRL